jgi:hypothetical protein
MTISNQKKDILRWILLLPFTFFLVISFAFIIAWIVDGFGN